MGEAVLKFALFVNSQKIATHVDPRSHTHRKGERTVAVCNKYKVPVDCLARQVSKEDFTTFTHILAADESNLFNLRKMAPKGSTAEIRLWGSYVDGKPIADPYYGGARGFEDVYQQCVRYSEAFLDSIPPSASL
ncbi:phosphotyrosine protein phosphatase I superfamily [Phellopilus nigrolimitatus]|nr:phosphotyrosine protein phosphatase I superfamily [Phellopilus nigrolimitatus]